MFEARLEAFRQRLSEAEISAALITDDDNVYYLTGYHDYLHMALTILGRVVYQTYQHTQS